MTERLYPPKASCLRNLKKSKKKIKISSTKIKWNKNYKQVLIHLSGISDNVTIIVLFRCISSNSIFTRGHGAEENIRSIAVLHRATQWLLYEESCLCVCTGAINISRGERSMSRDRAGSATTLAVLAEKHVVTEIRIVRTLQNRRCSWMNHVR